MDGAGGTSDAGEAELLRRLRAAAARSASRKPPPDPEGAAARPDPGRDPEAIDRRLRELLAERRGFDAAFGPLARRLVDEHLWRELGYDALTTYCRARLGLSVRSVRQRAWLERKMDAMPELRRALRDGVLTFSKALLVAAAATPANVRDRIREAASTTWQQTDREQREKERRQNRARGVRRLWGPADANETVALAVASARELARRLLGRPIDPGEALATIADHFRRVWEEHDRLRGGHCGRRMRERREVLHRCGGLCAVPGCSRAAVHEHHIVFRSQGGTDDLWNRLGLCAVHHLRGIHREWLTVSGRAGERLVWRFGAASGPAAAADAAVAGVAVDADADVESGSGSGSEFRTGARDGDAFGGAGPRCDPGPGPGPGQEWITTGDDDVRQADRAISSRRPQAREEVLMNV